MFKKMGRKKPLLSVLLALFLVVALAGSGYCATVATMGRKGATSGDYAVTVDSDNLFKFASDTSIKFPYQSGTTNDTLTAADSGRTYVVTSGAVSAVYLNLPAAAVGMVYPVIDGSTQEVYINPNGTDTINYASLSAGDTIYNSTSAKGDSITLFCVTANVWEVQIHNGTWADGNQ